MTFFSLNEKRLGQGLKLSRRQLANINAVMNIKTQEITNAPIMQSSIQSIVT